MVGKGLKVKSGKLKDISLLLCASVSLNRLYLGVLPARLLALMMSVLHLLLWAAPAHASGAVWSAWLYDSESGHLALVAADGVVVRDLYVPLSQGFNQLPSNAAFSHDGALLAFVAANSDTGERQLVVFDTAVQFQKLLVNPPSIIAEGISRDLDQNIFDDTDSMVAFPYVPSLDFAQR
jgi:hypothetical protein